MQESAIDSWPFWLLEENIKLVNELAEEEDTSRKKQEGDQAKGMPNYDGMRKNMSTPNFGNFSMPSF